MSESNWQPIKNAPKGAGPLLLREGSGSLDPAFVGYQDPDNGRWFSDNAEVHPNYFARIPLFDCEDDGQ
jgi:hypothetical protein